IKPAEFAALTAVYIEREGELRKYEVESLSPKGKGGDLKLKGIDSLSQADKLAGLEVYVPEESLKPPAVGQFYVYQLVGCSVLSRAGELIGRVKDVLSVGRGDLLVVDREGKEVLIPFHESICVEVDPTRKVIRVDLPDGLLELNEI
ncbi:MAG: ribosome maturation factor RimM, partial [Acidobacteriota bacterium]